MRNKLIWTLLVSGALAAAPAFAQDQADHSAHQTPPATPAPAEPENQNGMGDMSGMDHMHMNHGDEPMDQPMPMHHDMSSMHHGMHDMSSAYGAYPMTRDASGTSWQPDAGMHTGQMSMHGPWMLMGHARFNAVYDWQGGERGDEKVFLAGMIMGMARRDFASGDALQLRAMLSPDPLMGASGYPLLLASGETANGVDHLVDRQHPHDLFMELSASYSHKLSDADSVFVYAGLPGEPAFGPPAFMHRQSAMDDPQAPITHHWLDSTHITFGVVTAGFVHDNWKIEASSFNGREPDQHRYDIESPKLDSTSVRVTWNPNTNWSLQASWADQKSPEQLEPDVDVTRLSASAIYTVRMGDEGWWSSTLAYGLKEPNGGESQGAWALETAYHPNPAWTFFARAEQIETTELLEDHTLHTVQAASLGAIRDFKLAPHTTLGVGALVAHNFVPSALEPSYGGDPNGAMAFLRLKLND